MVRLSVLFSLLAKTTLSSITQLLDIDISFSEWGNPSDGVSTSIVACIGGGKVAEVHCEFSGGRGGSAPFTEQGKIEGLDFKSGGGAPIVPAKFSVRLCPLSPSQCKK